MQVTFAISNRENVTRFFVQTFNERYKTSSFVNTYCETEGLSACSLIILTMHIADYALDVRHTVRNRTHETDWVVISPATLGLPPL